MSTDVDSSATAASTVRRTAEIAKAKDADGGRAVKPVSAAERDKRATAATDRVEAARPKNAPARVSEPAMPKVEKAAADKVSADKIGADKVAADKIAADKIAADKVADKPAVDKVGPAAPAVAAATTAPVPPAAPPVAPAEKTATPAEQRQELDDKMKARAIPDAQRNRINASLAKLEGPALAKEKATLDNALKSENATRAVATYDKLNEMAAKSPLAKERLDADTRASLVKGVADSRSSTATGVKGILGSEQAEKAAKAIVDMPQAQHDELKASLAKAGQGADGKPAPGADASAERSLMLKAVAARGDKLADPKTAPDAMKEVTGFADKVRGTERSELIKSTTALGVGERDGVGLAQRWEDSCGPTTAQFTQAERDPVYANKLRTDPAFAAAEQKATLEKPRFTDKKGDPVAHTPAQEAAYWKDGTMPPGATHVEAGVAVSRAGNAAEARLQATLHGEAGKALSDTEARQLERHAQNEKLTPAEQKEADKAIEKLRAADGGKPSDDDLAAIRSNYTQNRDGSSTKKKGDGMRLDDALNDVAPPKTWQANLSNGGRGGLSDGDMAAMDKKLQAGTDVPIRIANADNRGGHFMMVGDVRGNTPDRKYLVSDPWTGKSGWVPERDLKNPNGAWPRKYFDQGLASRITHTYAEK